MTTKYVDIVRKDAQGNIYICQTMTPDDFSNINAAVAQVRTNRDNIALHGARLDLITNAASGDTPASLKMASTTAAGAVRFATDTEVTAGTATDLAVSAKNLADVKTELTTELGKVYKPCGSVADMTALNALTGVSEGDVYNVVAKDADGDAGANYVAVFENGVFSAWDKLGGTFDQSDLVTLSGAQTIAGAKTFSSAITMSAAQDISTAANTDVATIATVKAVKDIAEAAGTVSVVAAVANIPTDAGENDLFLIEKSTTVADVAANS